MSGLPQAAEAMGWNTTIEAPNQTSLIDKNRAGSAFSTDVQRRGGYQYTDAARLSSVLANARISQAIRGVTRYRDRRVLDLGCGDGTYSIELFVHEAPALVVGIDPVAEAIEVAGECARRHGERLRFEIGDACNIAYEPNAFDVVILRGVLHHLDGPERAVREALRVGHEIVILEPNGLNLGVKMLERFSAYHRAHRERSFAPWRLERMIEAAGGEVAKRELLGLVPYFCPDTMARLCQRLQPLVEAVPVLNRFCCAQRLILGTRREGRQP